MKANLNIIRIAAWFIIAGLFLINPVFSQKITYSDPLNKAGFSLGQETRGGVTVNYTIETFTFSPVDINGKGMKNVELPGNFLPGDAGAPNLPGSGRYIAFPKGAVPVLTIVSQRTESFKNVDIAPSPEIPLDTDREPLKYPVRTDIYTTNAYYPATPVQLSNPTQIRGVDVVMLGVTPFQYNPVTKELIVYRDLEIRVDFQGGSGQIGEERLRSRFWDPILEDAVLNHKSIPAVDYSRRVLNPNRSNNGGDYLIIVANSDDYMNWAQEIRSFRIKQGIVTEIRTLEDVGGNSPAIIENFIDDVYENWDPVPAAILLMGDYGSNAEVNITSPIWDSYCVSDNIYGDVDEDDMPDIVMARMVGNNNTEMETFATKFINYETNPPTNPSFYDHPITALGWQTERWFQICSETVGGYFKNVQGKNPVRINEIYLGNPGSDPWSTATNTQVILDEFGPNGLGYIPATPQELGNWSGGNATAINNAINSGAFLLQHRDHGEETGWGEPQYGNGNIGGLTNTDLTFIFSINCLTGKYNWSGECFSEKFHRYRYNNVNSGALGVICASEVSYSFVNDTYVWGLFDNMWPDFMPEYGSTPAERGLLPAFGNAAGKYFLKASSWPYNSENKEVTYNLFHHFGDAFQTLYSEVPQEMTILHDGIILAGLNEFTITADAGSTICLTVDDDIIGLATGTGNPQVITITPLSVGTTVTLTVTKTNYFRHEEDIEVIPAEGAYCLYGNHTVADGIGGNGNGLVDYNETVGLSLGIRNVGMSDGDGVTVTISTLDPFIAIEDNTEFYGVIPSGQTVVVDQGFSFYAAENTPDQHQVLFSIVSTDGGNVWNSQFMLKVNAPVLNINAVTINDSENGNGNGILDPGEQAEMTVNYTNTGHATAYDVDVFMEGQSGYIEISNPEQNFASIGFLGVFNKTFDVSVDEITPIGININFVNDLSMGNFYSSKTFIQKVHPLIEDFETGNFNEYDWQFTGTLPWTTSNQYPYEGNFSALSGAISHGQTSEMKISYEVMSADSISFIRKVSSEATDKLQFYIGNTLAGEWSGTNEGWRREAFAVTPGYKTFRWVYTKNASGSGGADKAWLDNIHLPSPVALTIWAGPDEDICTGEEFQISGSYGTDYNTIEWTTSGTGTFTDNTQMQPVYSPSSEDFNNGSVVLTLTLTGDGDLIVSDEMVLTFNAGPEAPQAIEGPDYVDLFITTTSEYLTVGIEGITVYTWHLEPADAGTIEGSGLQSTVTWDPVFAGTAYISVSGNDECGEGDVSEAFEVTVGNSVGYSEDENSFGLSVYPNPGNGSFQVMIATPEQNAVTLKVINILGEVVYKSNQKVNGAAIIPVNIENLANGVYLLSLEGDGVSLNRKIVKR
ncbi:MAG TPA: C25 family cysteine peptidase [Bacteroidales bacterium]|nr:C25 family cysteine peptidase [Bacteroidales bacterium]